LKKAIEIICLAVLPDLGFYCPLARKFNDNQALNYFKPDITL
jgi:hypothetical protein